MWVKSVSLVGGLPDWRLHTGTMRGKGPEALEGLWVLRHHSLSE